MWDIIPGNKGQAGRGSKGRISRSFCGHWEIFYARTSREAKTCLTELSPWRVADWPFVSQLTCLVISGVSSGIQPLIDSSYAWTSQVVLVVKNPPANTRDARDMGSIPGSQRSPGVENDNPILYFYLENFMDRGAWWATVHEVEKSWTWLSTNTHTHTHTHTHTGVRRLVQHSLSALRKFWSRKTSIASSS